MKKWFLIFAAAAAIIGFTACSKKSNKQNVKPTIVSIETTVADAQISIDGKKVGKAPLKGKYKPGSYIVMAEKKGHETAWTNMVVKKGETTSVKLSLKPITSSVMLTASRNLKANVTLNGEVIGQTPIVIPDLAFGSYKATLKAPGHAPAVVKWEITDRRPQKITVSLTENTGIIRIERCVPGARIKINGSDRGQLPYEFRTEQGEYNVEVTAPGYAPFTQKVALASSRKEIVRPRLTQLPGALRITSKPEGAFVTVNGKRYGITPVKVENLPAGKVKVILSKNNFDRVVIDRVVLPGKMIPVHGVLHSSLGSIEFATQPAGVTVYLDGRRLVVTEKDPNSPGISKVFRTAGLRPGKHTLRFTHKRAKPSTITQVVTVEKNKNFRIEKPIEMWVPNAKIKIRSSGSVYIGRIVRQNDKEVTFEPGRKSRITYKRSELESIELLSEEE